jgi:hypothetical protein
VSASGGCIIQVAVTDYWPNLITPAGPGLPAARGGDTVGFINAAELTEGELPSPGIQR